MNQPQSLTIVIPAFNEAQRLPDTLVCLYKQLPILLNAGLRVTSVLVVDDGSKDATKQAAEQFADRLPVKVLGYQPNRGKGYAVRTGALQAQGDLLLIADADMSTPWPEAAKLFAALQNGAVIAMGSRSIASSEITTRQPWYRERMGKTFNLLMRMITRLPFRDTQCGFKLLQISKTAAIWPLLQVNRFAWDIELLMAANDHGLAMAEVGVVWNHCEQSRVHPVRDSLEMLISVCKIRLNKKWRPSKNSTR